MKKIQQIIEMENLYKVLQCDENASPKQLKKSYQELALKYHPDKSECGDKSAEKFIKINHAWTILSDQWLRSQYDVKWKERCLAQTFPIQDEVEFEEFDCVESTNLDGVLKSESNEKCSETAGNSNTDTVTATENNEDNANGADRQTNSENSCNKDNTYYIYPCRCGGNYTLTAVDVKLKFDIVCCDTCSLSVKVVYSEEEDEET